MRKTLIISAMAVLATPVCSQKPNYPSTARCDTVDEYFGTQVPDPYRWLEDDTSEATAAWVAAENAVTNEYLSRLPRRRQLLDRLREVSNYEKTGIPSEHHGKWYFYKNDGLQNQAVLYVMDELGGEPRVFLDPNTLSSDGTVALQSVTFSHNGKYAAYSISRSGSDWQEIYVLDAATGKPLSDHIRWVKFYGAAWQGDGFYYSSYDPVEGNELSAVNECHKIYYHRIGTPQSEDQLFYMNPAYPKRFYGVEVNEEETIMLLYESGAGAGNNLFVRDLRNPSSQFMQMTTDMDYQYGFIDNIGDTLFIQTNHGANRGKVVAALLRSPGIDHWQTVIPEQEGVVEAAQIINNRLLVTCTRDASTHAFLYTLDGKMLREITLPSVGSAGFNGKKNRPECFYSFSSFTVPGSIYRYDMDSGESTLYKAPKVAFRSSDFVSEQVFFTSKDGTRVPMFITYKKGLKRNGKNPTLLYGYGGFNIGLTPSFSAMRLPFLEKGGIYAMVNLRGGNEYGEEWHLAGTKMQKQNVFDDFIAATEWLIAQGYTNSGKVAIQGGSNGGLLVGACMTQRPDLFAVAIPQVGVMDMLRYHKFTIGWNWASD
ncbi:MAG: S9 family peptidase, partial [Prevotella sp.]|nr:S9 family peptidase [Prevotella sp.]